MKVVYVSGPIGPVDGPNRQGNINRALAIGAELVTKGFAPIIPHLYTFLNCDVDYEAWMKVDFAFIKAANVVLRIPGYSPGADREVTHAMRINIPVVFSVEELERIR